MSKQLVIQLARFGDIVQTKRLILSLQRHGEVHLCVNCSLESVARLVYPDISVFGMPAGADGGHAIFQDAAKSLAALKAEHFDAVYALNHAGLCRAMTSLFDPAIVRGYPIASGQALRSNWVRLAFRWMTRRAEAPLNLVDFWAALAPDMVAPHAVNPVASPGGKGLGVVMAGRNARRSLPVEELALVVRAAFERLGGPRVYLFGSGAEQGAARRLLAHLPATIVGKTSDLTGRTDWAGLADALSGLDVLLSPDTGTAHLAAHLGVPVEGLFLSSAWGFETGPYGQGHRIWQAVRSCAPCTESSPCGLATACLDAFRSPPFLARMQGRTGGAALRHMEGMALLYSDFDALGEIWPAADGSEDLAAQDFGRAALRGLLAEYLGIPLHAACTVPPGSPHEAEAWRDGKAAPGFAGQKAEAGLWRDYAEFLYQEADWMLPQSLP